MRTTTAKIKLFKNAFDWIEFTQNWSAKITTDTTDDGQVVFGVTWWSGDGSIEEAEKAADQLRLAAKIAEYLNGQDLSIDPQNDVKRYTKKQDDDSLPVLIKAIQGFDVDTIKAHFEA